MTLTITTDQYIYPPRAQNAIPRADTEIFSDLGWIAQFKYNDSRCIIKYCPDGTVELWNRHAERFRTYHLPDHLREQLQTLRALLGLNPHKTSMLDGGLLDQKHQAIKDTIVIWDILVRDDQHLIGTTYSDRYDQLLPHADQPWVYEHSKHAPINFGNSFTQDTFIPISWEAPLWPEVWNTVETVNAPWTIGKPNDPDYQIKPVLEGLFFKDPNGTLEMGYREKNNDSWQIRSRVHTGRHRF